MMNMKSDLFCYPPAKPPEQLNPIVLAYIGDAVFEMFIRQYVVSKSNHKPQHLHRLSTGFVSAKAQAKALQQLIPLLDEEESDIVRRGRNAKSGSAPKSSDVLEYRHSTAFECLIGYLYYKQSFDRLQEIMNQALEILLQEERRNKP